MATKWQSSPHLRVFFKSHFTHVPHLGPDPSCLSLVWNCICPSCLFSSPWHPCNRPHLCGITARFISPILALAFGEGVTV